MPDMAISTSSFFNPDRNLSRGVIADGNPTLFESADSSCAVSSFSGCLGGSDCSVQTEWVESGWPASDLLQPTIGLKYLILRSSHNGPESRPSAHISKLICLECNFCHSLKRQGKQATQ